MTIDASWIWGTGEPAPRNVLMQFRRELELDAVPEAAQLHISADSRYILYVNGARIGYGPARAYHYRYELDIYDLAEHLRPGRNVIAVAVAHWGEGTFMHMVGRAGLIAQLHSADGLLLRTDAAWRAKPSAGHRRAVPRIAVMLPWEEQVDARLLDTGWTEAGFDDNAWPHAVEVGPAGIAPWGTLHPRTIPFLTDEPQLPVAVTPLGLFRKPEVVAALHAGPYLAPGDLSANQHTVDALIATTLELPTAGTVTLKRCTLYGSPPHLFVDGHAKPWERFAVDAGVTLELAAGTHAVLLDWQALTHDLDMTLTFAGVPGMAVRSPLGAEHGTWAIVVEPGEARARAQTAADPDALRAATADWQPVVALDTPPADVYMELTASSPVEHAEGTAGVPLTVPPAPPQHARHFLVDFGRQLIGWLELEITASAGTTVDLLGFEALPEGQPQLTELMNNTLRYVCRDGRQRYQSTLRRGLRYLLVAVHGAAEPAVLHAVGLRLATYPWTLQGTFRCADERLNRIWDMCSWTLRLCSEDTFTDCPTYEQTLWSGDASHSDVLVHQTIHGDSRLTRRTLLLVADSLQRLPIGGSIPPGDWENHLIPNWAWFWAMGCADYYRLTADHEFAAAVYPALQKQAATIAAARNAAGLVELPGYWHFLDWTTITADDTAVLTHESCLAVGALKATAALADAIGNGADAEHWRGVAAELAAAINRACWDAGRGAYTDTPDGGAFSQPTNTSAVYTGVADAERSATLLPKLVDCPADWVPAGTPWMFSLALQELASRGQVAPVVAAIRERWGDMLDHGATTAWESFRRADGAWSRSWCHAWSALPAYLLSAYVLGVRPLAPGFSRALVAPELGDLGWAEGQVPTPHGPIHVRAERIAGRVVVEVRAPEGVVVEMRAPSDDS